MTTAVDTPLWAFGVTAPVQAAARPRQVAGPSLDELEDAADRMAALVATHMGRVAGYAARHLGGIVIASGQPAEPKTPLWAFHLPGKHDQSSHGRGAGGVRPSLAQASTIRELNAAAEAELGRIGGGDVQVDMRGSDLQTAKEHLEGVARGLEQFPDAPLESVNAADLPLGIWAQVSGGRDIHFNEKHSQTLARQNYTETVAKSADGWNQGPEVYGIDTLKVTSYHVRGADTPVSVGLHEMGHVVHLGPGRGTAPAGTDRQIDGLVDRLGTAGVGSTEFGGSPVISKADFVQRSVSGYALDNRPELVAEAFTDVVINGSDSSELSQGIFKILEGQYT